jgi:hypothetical protein
MKIVIFVFVFVWLGAAVFGVVYLARYENTAGEGPASYPTSFPSESRIAADHERSTLIFFAHPKCPCTRASLHELERLMTDLRGKLNAFVVFSKPKDVGEDWTETDLYEIARRIPDVGVIIDDDDRETDIFKAQTSGLTLVYDQQGILQFNGGITASRGHEGDNAGRSTVFDVVTRNAAGGSSPVFGCPIHKKDCEGEQLDEAGFVYTVE